MTGFYVLVQNLKLSFGNQKIITNDYATKLTTKMFYVRGFHDNVQLSVYQLVYL